MICSFAIFAMLQAGSRDCGSSQQAAATQSVPAASPRPSLSGNAAARSGPIAPCLALSGVDPKIILLPDTLTNRAGPSQPASYQLDIKALDITGVDYISRLVKRVLLVPKMGRAIEGTLKSSSVQRDDRSGVLMHYAFGDIKRGDYTVVLEWLDPSTPYPPCAQEPLWFDSLGSVTVV